MAMIKALSLCCVLTALCMSRMSLVAASESSSTCCPVVELRQYTTNPGQRDALIELYEDEFIETQESAGIALPGQFRVVGFPNKFDWLQGFSSMAARKNDFEAFYHGSAWKRYRKRVNSLLLDYGNVILLHPAHNGSGFAARSPRAPRGSREESRGVVVATIYYLRSYTGTQFDELFENSIRSIVSADGSRVLATFVTDHAPNNFPILPVRADVDLFVWFACYRSETAYELYANALSNDSRWWTVEGKLVLAQMYIPPEVDLLQPTSRSLLRC
jgi:hypothetical protein